MGPTLKLPSTITAGADWTTPNNALVEDAAVAWNGNVGPGGGGHTASQLEASGYGFTLPSSAVIDGIKLEAKVSSGFSSDASILIKTSTKTSSDKAAPFPNSNDQLWPNSGLTWLTWGGPTDLWGRTDWLPADINSSSFAGSISASPTHATDTINVDAVRITVYWHVANQEVPKRHVYKVFNSLGQYLGNLPNVTSNFAFSQDINTAGAQITIICGVSPDTSRLATDVLTDEAGNILTDESSNSLTNEGQSPVVSPGNLAGNALIKNGNTLQVFEYSYYWPNGKCMFLGQIQRWEAEFGGNGGNDYITVLAYSDGQDMDNYLVRGNPYTYTTDVSQTSQNASAVISQGSGGLGGGGWNFYGQSWVPGAGVTNLGAISLLLNGSANVSVIVYSDAAFQHVIGATSQAVSVGGATEIQLAFANPIVVVPGTTYYFAVEVDGGQSIIIYYSTANPYSGGDMQNSFYGGGAGGGAWGVLVGSDLYFKTASGTGATTGTFTSQDPSTGTLETVLNDYRARGGLITYDSTTIDATGLSLTYTFNTNTVYEALKTMLTLAPDGFYYYVDVGTDALHFKRANTVADLVLTKGRHIDKLNFIATIENIKNQVYFSGGATSGVNLYKTYSDPTSIGLYGPRLDRRSDNRVTVAATADAIGNSAIAEEKDEQYQTTVTLLDRTTDITLVKVGMIVGFNGFGTFADNVLAQIVRVDYTPEELSLTLGILPKRLAPEFDRITRGLVAEQTVANPSAPS